MKEETRQEIVQALNQAKDDLSKWLRELGVPEEGVSLAYQNLLRENGFGSQLLLNAFRGFVPLDQNVPVKAEGVAEELSRLHSTGFEDQLLNQPEPDPSELEQLLKCFKELLPNLREHFLKAGKLGPRHRRGGRPRELSDPGQQDQIRKKAQSLRKPGVRIQDIDKRLAHKYGVSPTTIKRIRTAKKPAESPTEE